MIRTLHHPLQEKEQRKGCCCVVAVVGDLVDCDVRSPIASRSVVSLTIPLRLRQIFENMYSALVENCYPQSSNKYPNSKIIHLANNPNYPHLTSFKQVI